MDDGVVALVFASFAELIGWHLRVYTTRGESKVRGTIKMLEYIFITILRREFYYTE